jgi:hypothetical protein
MKAVDMFEMQKAMFYEQLKLEFLEFIMNACDVYMNKVLEQVETIVHFYEQGDKLVYLETTKVKFERIKSLRGHSINGVVVNKLLAASGTTETDYHFSFLLPVNERFREQPRMFNDEFNIDNSLLEQYENLSRMFDHFGKTELLIAEIYPDVKVEIIPQ